MWCWSWMMTKLSTLKLAYFLLTNKETPVLNLVLWIPFSCIDHSPQGLLTVILFFTTSCYRVWVFQNWLEVDLKLWLVLLSCDEGWRQAPDTARYTYKYSNAQVSGRLRWLRGVRITCIFLTSTSYSHTNQPLVQVIHTLAN